MQVFIKDTFQMAVELKTTPMIPHSSFTVSSYAFLIVLNM